jgi:hypothetical protein
MFCALHFGKWAEIIHLCEPDIAEFHGFPGRLFASCSHHNIPNEKQLGALVSISTGF